MKRVLYILIGPKGSGKTHIGMLVGRETSIRFLRVESIWVGLKPGEDGWQKVEQAVDELFLSSERVMIESLGAGEGFRGMYASLRSKYTVKLIHVRARLDTCLQRVRSRSRAEHIPVSDEQVEEYNRVAAAVCYDWELELDNDPALPDAEILRAIEGLGI